jgi:hypothetical protein
MKKMTTWLTVVALLAAMTALAVAGCGGQSPTQAADEFTQHLNNREFGEAYDMLSSSSPLKAVSRDDFIKNAQQSLPNGSRVDNFQVTEEDVNGDTATVKWTGTEKVPGQPDQTQNGTWTLNREDDQWKLKP